MDHPCATDAVVAFGRAASARSASTTSRATSSSRFKDAGLPPVRFHALRDAFATTLLADGEDLANVSKLLGHRDLATTANVYGHLSDQASRRAANRMERVLRRAQ